MLLHRCLGGLLLGLLVALSLSAKAQRMHQIAKGVWGGPHISMQVGPRSATIEYDCATGVINGPLVVDSKGDFKLHGTHHRQHGGPVRADEDESGQPATFTGTIKGNVMTLNLKLDNAEVETFSLEHGNEGEVFKCR